VVTLKLQVDRAQDLLTAFDVHYKKAQQIDGWLTEHEALALFTCAAGIKAESPVVVEIGSYLGKSSVCIAGGLLFNPRGRLYCVDPFDQTDEDMYLTERDRKKVGSLYGRFVANTWEYRNLYIRKGFSSALADSSSIPRELDMLFIDGNHSYGAVRADIFNWVPRLKPGGILAMHDVELPPDGNPHVLRVVADLGIGNPQLGWQNTTHVTTLYLTQRTEKPWTTLALSQ
jgi:predicted O-methyltransferase YrrM